MNKRPSLTKKPKETTKKIHEYKRDSKEVAFYKTYKWRKTSEQFRKVNPLCVQCKEEGRTRKADVVDHIKPIQEGGEHFEQSNLQSLCHKHHNKKTAKDYRNKLKD